MRCLRMASAIAVLAMCGCVDPGQFQQPIATFASASDTAATSFSTLDSESAAKLSAIEQRKAIALKHVAWSGTECNYDATACTLFIKPNGVETPIVYTSLMPKSVAFVNGIRDYAKALDDLEKADATAQVQSAFSDALSAAAVVAGVVNVPTGSIAAAVSKPLAATFGWGFKQYQNSLKYNALKRATLAADQIIQDAVPVLDGELRLINAGQNQGA